MLHSHCSENSELGTSFLCIKIIIGMVKRIDGQKVGEGRKQ